MKLLERLFGRGADDDRHDVTVDLDGSDGVRVTCSCGFVRAELADEAQGKEVATAHLRETFRL
jgi:hypothetical protein